MSPLAEDQQVYLLNVTDARQMFIERTNHIESHLSLKGRRTIRRNVRNQPRTATCSLNFLQQLTLFVWGHLIPLRQGFLLHLFYHIPSKTRELSLATRYPVSLTSTETL